MLEPSGVIVRKAFLVVPFLIDARKAPWAKNLLPGNLPPEAAYLYFWQRMYVSSSADVEDWRPFPLHAPDEVISKSPSVDIFVAEFDLLCPEGEAFAERLLSLNIDARVLKYAGPHSLLRLDTILPAGSRVRRDIMSGMKAVLN